MREEDFYQIFITGTGDYLGELLEKGLGGVIFFSKDILSKDGFKSLVSDIKLKAKLPPFLSIDQEGGRVERTENIYPKRLSAKFAYEKGREYLISQTEVLADELLEFGINLNFAPVADINTNPNNPIIGERAFGDTLDSVIDGVDVVSNIYLDKGIIPCVKHYPGHGDVEVDSHKTLPKLKHSLAEMEKTHLAPFKFASDINLPMVMIAHLDCECFGQAGIPTSLSKNAIDYLRTNLGFKGVIITDDMNMGGVNYLPPVEAAIRALKAGVNILLYRASDNETYKIIQALRAKIEKDKELETVVRQSVEKIAKLKTQYL